MPVVAGIAASLLVTIGCAGPSGAAPSSPSTKSPSTKRAASRAFDWAGRYALTETCGRTAGGTAMVIVHVLTVSHANGGYVADLDSDGFQTEERLQLAANASDDTLALVMDRARSGNLFDTYRKGDLLFSLSRRDGSLRTIWDRYALACPTPRRDESFEREP